MAQHDVSELVQDCVEPQIAREAGINSNVVTLTGAKDNAVVALRHGVLGKCDGRVAQLLRGKKNS
ncbi:hypothetical protein AB0P16_11600 [Dietzia maris]|uniref:hypothetical protein n=1 Tax=Dietzia maris TaxID=37915 RepID=UPI00342A40C3